MVWPYSQILTAVTGGTLAASDWNSEQQNHINNNIPTSISGISSNTTNMQTVVDPGGVGTESLATDLAGELQRIRFMLKNHGGGAQWYTKPGALLPVAGGTMTGPIAMGTSKITGIGAATTAGDVLRYEQIFGVNVTLGGSLSFSPSTLGIGGTATNDDAAASVVGEYVTASYSAVNAATSGQFKDGASIVLSAGDWEVEANFMFNLGSAVLTGTTLCGIGTATGNSATGLSDGDTDCYIAPPNSTVQIASAYVKCRKSISGSTTFYAKLKATYSTSTPTFSGRISARRVR